MAMTHQEDCLGLHFHDLGWVWEAQEMSWGGLLGQVHLSFFSVATTGEGFESVFLSSRTWLKKRESENKVLLKWIH